MSKTVGTIVIAKIINGEYHVLVCRRAMHLDGGGTIFTQGGTMNHEETPLQCALREAREEAGISKIEPTTVQLVNVSTINHSNKTKTMYYNFVVVVESNFSVIGPLEEWKNECIQLDEICGIKTIKSMYGKSLEGYVAWVPYTKILAANESNRSGTKTIISAINYLNSNSKSAKMSSSSGSAKMSSSSGSVKRSSIFDLFDSIHHKPVISTSKPSNSESTNLSSRSVISVSTKSENSNSESAKRSSIFDLLDSIHHKPVSSGSTNLRSVSNSRPVSFASNLRSVSNSRPVISTCRVIGCTSCKYGKSHRCRLCGDTNSTHRSGDCPMKKCKVSGCTDCGLYNFHYCKFCGDTNSTHRSRSCPRKKG